MFVIRFINEETQQTATFLISSLMDRNPKISHSLFAISITVWIGQEKDRTSAFSSLDVVLPGDILTCGLQRQCSDFNFGSLTAEQFLNPSQAIRGNTQSCFSKRGWKFKSSNPSQGNFARSSMWDSYKLSNKTACNRRTERDRGVYLF